MDGDVTTCSMEDDERALTADERRLLALMRSMTPQARLASLHYAEFMASRCPAHEVVRFPRSTH